MTPHGRRIVIVQAGLGAGGTEKVVSKLAAHLDSQGHQVTILSIVGRESESFYTISDRVHLRTMEAETSRTATRSTLSRILWLRRVLRETHGELVISFLTKINIQVAVASIGLHVRRIASERNNFKRQQMHPLWRLLMPVALATADASVMLTHASRSALPRWARGNAVVIHNAAATQPPEPIKSAPPQRLIAVGRLTEQKGFDVLIRAIQLARQQVSDMTLTIYGDGEDRDALVALAEDLGQGDAISFPGKSQTPHGWMKGGGIFVLSSRYEGFANVLVEAMSAGFAVVSTDCDWGPAEIVTDGESGLLVRPEDAESLASVLVRVWNDGPLRTRLSLGARARTTQFTEERILREWDAVVRDALRDRRPKIRAPRLFRA